jgi:hypothetical protein
MNESNEERDLEETKISLENLKKKKKKQVKN